MHGGRNVFKILIQWYINIININPDHKPRTNSKK